MAAKKSAKGKKAAEQTGQAQPKRGEEASANAGGLPEELIETVLEEDDVDDAPPATKKGK